MVNEHDIHNTGIADGQAEYPAWLTDLVSKSVLPEEFDRRCRVASKAAFAIDRLRRELSQHRLAPRPFGNYLRGLADLGSIPVDDIKVSFGIPDWDHLSVATASAFGRLARLIELSPEQAELCFRGEYAVPHGLIPVEHYGRPAESFPEALNFIESGYSDTQRAELAEILRLIRSEYERMG